MIINFILGLYLHLISGWSDIRPFYIRYFFSGGELSLHLLKLWPNIRFHLPDIWLNYWTNDANFEWANFSEPFQLVKNKSEIVTRNVGGFCWKIKFSIFKKNRYLLFSRIFGLRQNPYENLILPDGRFFLVPWKTWLVVQCTLLYSSVDFYKEP